MTFNPEDRVKVTIKVSAVGVPSFERSSMFHPAGIHWYVQKTADNYNALVEAFVDDKLIHKVDMRKGTALRNLILTVEAQLVNEEICLTDIEAALHIARAEYYNLTGFSVEGEK